VLTDPDDAYPRTSETVPVDDRADDAAGGHDSTVLGEPHVEGQPAAGVVDQGRLRADGGTDRGGSDVVQLDPGADRRLAGGEDAGGRGDGRRLGQRQGPRGAEHLDVTRAQGEGGVGRGHHGLDTCRSGRFGHGGAR
jgi:hypothetical protein